MKPGFKIVKTLAGEVAPAKPSDATLLEPWFRNRAETVASKRLQTYAARQKFADFFEILGCVRCGTKNKPHRGEGFCASCHAWFSTQLQRAIRARQNGEFDGNRRQ